ncbi:MAG: cysteine-rich small domain-containing protein [Lachnospiraceae bacterium]|nr:cysteine-rich small domain-containing protein [Lachnospiraceae bacterium]
MENSYKFFCNNSCEYFPCHKDIDENEFNCLFCYCPLYRLKNCPGVHYYIKSREGKDIKVCSDCVFPHKPENYEKIIEILVKNP